MSATPLQRWDIFCRVVDNYGDIGVSWRVAWQLVHEHGLTVRLWVNQLASLQALVPQVQAHAVRQTVQGIEVFSWREGSEFPPPGDGVIEAFGCGLPPTYVQTMAARTRPPLWIVLEYLSAEPWVREHHGLPSPHPRLNLQRYFFFPGFTEGTGGVPREANLLARRDAFDENARRAWWASLGFDDVPRGALTVSVFAYPQAPLIELINACAQGDSPVVLVLCAGAPADSAREHFGGITAHRATRGNVEARWLPFVPQAEYDALLWASDVNFVRGEDTFVRAQWAGQPFVWHIYAQAENAHVVKLDAFLKVYGAVLTPSAAHAVRDMWHAWNHVAGAPPLRHAWSAFCRELQAQKHGLSAWRQRLLGLNDLTHNLLNFCQKMV